jgi:alpha,alpha-trehalase
MQEITKRCSGKQIALFLDYDGTLTPIVSRPEDAVLSEEVRKTLRDLTQQCRVAVISGRDLQDVRSLVGIEELIYAGSHGFDIAGPAGLQMQNKKAREYLPLLDRVEETFRKRLKEIQGTLVERKKFSIAVHYRAVKSKDLNKVTEIVKEVLKTSPTLRMSPGKKVYDLQPDIEWNKGKALLWLLEKLNLNSANTVPFYIGDDTTDEDAFSALAERGISIVVKDGNRKTAADYLLGNTDHVKTFLRALIPVVRGGAK